MIELNDKGYYAIPVPGDAENFRVKYDLFRNAIETREQWLLEWDSQVRATHNFVIFSKWKPEYICTSESITEEQAKRIVTYDIHPMLDYILGYTDYSISNDNTELDTALESFRTLLKSQNLTRVAIIKKQE